MPTELLQDDVPRSISIPRGWRAVISRSIAFNPREESTGRIRVNDCEVNSKFGYADLRPDRPTESPDAAWCSTEFWHHTGSESFLIVTRGVRPRDRRERVSTENHVASLDEFGEPTGSPQLIRAEARAKSEQLRVESETSHH